MDKDGVRYTFRGRERCGDLPFTKPNRRAHIEFVFRGGVDTSVLILDRYFFRGRKRSWE